MAGQVVSGKVARNEAATGQDVLVQVLRVEGEARAQTNLDDLAQLLANETRALLKARQVFVLRSATKTTFETMAASGLVTIDRQVPLVQELENIAARVHADSAPPSGIRDFRLDTVGAAGSATRDYPFRCALWVPMRDPRSNVFAAMVLLKEEPWREHDTVLAARLSSAFAQAWYWMATTRTIRPRWHVDRRKAAVAAIVGGVICLLPIRLSTLAPLEVAPRGSLLVAAPIDGVIEDIPIAPNATVKAGDVLVRLNDTTLRNRLDVAEREIEVADARVKKTLLLAVTDIRGRHELAQARGEYQVKLAERDYARDLLRRSVVTAATAGMALYADRRDLIGRPISVGERIMEIATAGHVEVRIDVPVSDAIILGADGRVKLFLDSQPLQPVEAKVVSSSYQTRMSDAGTASYRVIAELADGEGVPRLGTRGTAQLYGDRVPLIYYALRRPFQALRQWVGL